MKEIRLRLLTLTLFATTLLLIGQLSSHSILAQGSNPETPFSLWATSSPFKTPIPTDATYTPEPRIGTFRHGFEEWSMPVYRLESSADVPLVTVVNRYSGRTEEWPIPTSAIPASASDGHMAVLFASEGTVYEFWATKWLDDGNIQAGGMVSFPLDGPGISNPPHYRVTAAGFAVSAGMILREDFIDPDTGALNPNNTIDHALSVSLPFELVIQDGFVPPAVGGEGLGEAGLDGVPIGAQFAVDPALDVDSLDIHPLARELLRAARDYGMYVVDTNGAPEFNDLYTGTVRIEPGLVKALYGEDHNTLTDQIAEDVFAVLEDSGLYRVTLPGVNPAVILMPADEEEDIESTASKESEPPRK